MTVIDLPAETDSLLKESNNFQTKKSKISFENKSERSRKFESERTLHFGKVVRS